MHPYKKIFSLLPLLFLLGCQTNPPQITTNWNEVAHIDVLSVYRNIHNNHPGVVDPKNPNFKHKLASDKQTFSQLADKVSNEADYRLVLRQFVNSYQNMHLVVQFLGSPPDLQWPGFLIDYAHQNYIVGAREDDAALPAKGAKLISCDGKSADTLYEERLLPFYGISGLDTSKVFAANYLLIDDGNHFQTRLNTCVFESSGQQTSIALHWKPLKGSAFERMCKQLQPNPHIQPEVEKFADGAYWISIPSFYFDSKESLVIVNDFLNTLQQQQMEIRSAPFIVLDMRGNTGGLLNLVEQIASAIWGDDFIHAVDNQVHGDESIRFSKANIEDIAKEAAKINDQEALEKVQKILNEPHIDIFNTMLIKTLERTYIGSLNPINPVQGQVFLLTDYYCFSGCLMFADYVLNIPGTYHLGLPTLGDTRYTGVRSVPLTSKNSALMLPTMIIENKVRYNNEAYSPQATWTGDINDTLAIKQWIRDIYQQQQFNQQ